MYFNYAVTKQIVLGISACVLILAHNLVSAANSEQLFPDAQQLTVHMLVDAVLQRNPGISARQAAWEMARARIAQVDAFDDPIITYSVAPRTTDAPVNELRQSLSISQRLPWPGKLGLRGNTARLQAQAAFETIEEKRLELTGMSKQIFSDWYFIHAALRINEINKSLLEEFKDIAQIKYAAGSVTKQDVLLAETRYVLLQQREISLQRNKQAIQVSLNTLLDQAPATTILPPVLLPQPALLPDVALLLDRSIQTRPALRALKNNIQAAQSRLDLTEKDYFPDFNLRVLYNGVMDPADKRPQIGIGFNIPLRGKRHAAKDAAQSQLAQQQLAYRQRVLNISSEVQRAYDRVRESEQLLQIISQRLLPLAEETLSAAQADYESSRGDFLALINAEKQLINTQLNHEKTLSAYHRRLAQLEQAVGNTDLLSDFREGN